MARGNFFVGDVSVEFFTLFGEPEEGGEQLDIEGTIDIDADDPDDREITLFPNRGTPISDGIVLDFTRLDLDTLQLSAEGTDDEDLFLDLIELNVQGEVGRVVVRLSET